MHRDSIRQELGIENQLTLLKKLIGQKLRARLKDHNFREKTKRRKGTISREIKCL